jgi:hypothetical protein
VGRGRGWPFGRFRGLVRTAIVLERALKPNDSTTAQEINEVSLAVTLESMCERYHCLPDEGGILNQDQLLIRQMQIVSAAKHERSERERKERERKRKK